MAEQPKAEEFFYTDDDSADGVKQDADLHNAIINPVDFPIDEEIMAPIRARHRAEHVNQQRAKLRAARWVRVKAKAEAALVNGQNGLYRGWDEAEHPRHPAGSPEGGQFVGDGGGSEGSGKPAPGGTGAGGKPDAGLPRTFSRESPTDAQRSRDVVAVWRPTAAAAAGAKTSNHTPLTFYEYSGDAGAKTFHNAITRAKTGEFGASVTAYPVDDYKAMRLFTSPDGQNGFALKGDDIVSVFKHPDSKVKGFAHTALTLATEQGGRRLDAFDTQLPRLYSKSGFTAVARLPFNDDYAPDGWDRETYKEFNGGRPDVVFMVHDPANAKLYVKGDGRTVSDYDEGTTAQQRGAGSPSFAQAKAIKAGWIERATVKTIDDVKREAVVAQNMLGEAGREISDRHGLTFKDPGPKTKTERGVQRVLDKAAERGGNLAAVTDTARATFLVDHPQQTDQIIAELGKKFEVAAEPWKVTDMNYGDRAVNVLLPNGVIAEVQMMHPDMAWAKSPQGGGGHDLYKISRVAAPDGRSPDPVKFADSMAKQRELYGKVYEGLSDDWKAAFGKAGKSG